MTGTRTGNDGAGGGAGDDGVLRIIPGEFERRERGSPEGRARLRRSRTFEKMFSSEVNSRRDVLSGQVGKAAG